MAAMDPSMMPWQSVHPGNLLAPRTGTPATHPVGMLPGQQQAPQGPQQTAAPAQGGVNPSYIPAPPSSNPAQVYGVPNIGSDQFTQQILQAMAPIFGQQQHGLTEALANAGIVGGSTTGAQGNLANEQNSQAVGQIAPLIASIMQGNQSTALQGGEFNATQQNAAQQFDIGNLLREQMFNSGNFNQLQQFLLGGQNQDWLSQLGANASLAGGQQQAYQPVFQQPSPMNLGGLGASMAPTPTITNGNVNGSNPMYNPNPYNYVP